MNKKERIEILKVAHQEYVDWWLPIDVAAGSVMAPVSFPMFLQYLLKLPEEVYWDRWIGDKIPKDKKIEFKQFVINTLIEYYCIDK